MRAALLLCAVVSALGPGAACAADHKATPENFSKVFASAEAGDRILLASGDYGDWAGGSKSGKVTIAPQPGARPVIGIDFNNVANLKVEGVTIRWLAVRGRSHDLTFARSTFTGGATVQADRMRNANILFDRNSHANIDVCRSCYEGRIQVTGRSGNSPSGVTIRNSRIGPGGDADGIQIGATGVKVLNNEFVGIKQVSATHTDSLQLYGARRTVIRNNYFHDFTVAIMAPDGGDREIIANNVFDGDGSYRPAVQLGSHDGTRFVHNTLRRVDVFMDRKNESPQNSTNGVLRDNVLVNGTINAPPGKCTGCTVSYNLFTSRAGGSNAIRARPRFAGGADPTTWAGFALAAGSRGKRNASDGRDRGINVAGVATPGAGAGAPTRGG